MLEFHRVGQESFCSRFKCTRNILTLLSKSYILYKRPRRFLGYIYQNFLCNFDFIFCDALVSNQYPLVILTVYAERGALCLLLLSEIPTSTDYEESEPISLVTRDR